MAGAADALRKAVEADIAAPRREFLFRLPAPAERALQALLEDARDLPVALLLANILLTAVPGALLVALRPSHALGAAFLAANYAAFLQRFLVALLHVSEHRPLFRKELLVGRLLNLLPPLLLAPLYGVPSGMYKLHHRVMHHVEGNCAPGDASSTEPYQRDSWAHFARYWAWHALGGWVQVPLYAARAGRWRLLAECLAGEAAYLACAWLAWRRSPVAATWLLLLPFLLTSVALMFGNWSQHMFVDPAEPQNVFRLAYNCVGCADNACTFNDGYHVLHHLNSRAHWSELPARLLAQLDAHAAQGALVFGGVGFFEVGALVMAGRLPQLAARLLPCGAQQAALSHAERVQLLRSRLAPVTRRPRCCASEPG